MQFSHYFIVMIYEIAVPASELNCTSLLEKITLLDFEIKISHVVLFTLIRTLKICLKVPISLL